MRNCETTANRWMCASVACVRVCAVCVPKSCVYIRVCVSVRVGACVYDRERMSE